MRSANVDPLFRAISRRSFLLVAAGAGAAGLTKWYYRQTPVDSGLLPDGTRKPVTIVEFSDAGERLRTITVEPIVKSEEEWKKQLSPASFEVTRHAATERAFTGELLNVHDKGVFRCICCDTALYDSKTKFESGTGWPSFWQPIAKENVIEIRDTDYGMVRTAISCRRCDAHLGHVFDDGPKPTGLRYCMNSVALRFAKAS